MNHQSESATRITRSQGSTTLLRRFAEAQRRERELVLTEILRVRGLMPLLMKPRNGEPWNRAEKRELVEQFRALTHLSPYLVLLLLPGSVLMLPVLAWWLDRRRQRRKTRARTDEPGSA